MTSKLILLEKGIIVDGIPISKPFFRLKEQFRNLRGRSLVIGLIGSRGSGKSTGAARIIVMEYLLAKRNVWSNMPVGVDLMVKQPGGSYISKPLQTLPLGKLDLNNLDKVYQHGTIFMDEINQGVAEARRSMKQENLMFSYLLQQIRKRDLDIIWTAQSEMHVEDRLRFQTDIIIKCHDVSLLNKNAGVGEYSKWEIWDYSGLVSGGEGLSKLPASPVIFNKPWWNVFDTTQMQAGEEEEEAEEDKEQTELVNKIANYIMNFDKPKVIKDIVWGAFRIMNQKEQREITKLLIYQHGIVVDSTNRQFMVSEELAGVR